MEYALHIMGSLSREEFGLALFVLAYSGSLIKLLSSYYTPLFDQADCTDIS